MEEMITDFINFGKRLTINTAKCQSLRKYASDLQYSVCQNSNFFIIIIIRNMASRMNQLTYLISHKIVKRIFLIKLITL